MVCLSRQPLVTALLIQGRHDPRSHGTSSSPIAQRRSPEKHSKRQNHVIKDIWHISYSGDMVVTWWWHVVTWWGWGHPFSVLVQLCLFPGMSSQVNCRANLWGFILAWSSWKSWIHRVRTLGSSRINLHHEDSRYVSPSKPMWVEAARGHWRATISQNNKHQTLWPAKLGTIYEVFPLLYSLDIPINWLAQLHRISPICIYIYIYIHIINIPPLLPFFATQQPSSDPHRLILALLCHWWSLRKWTQWRWAEISLQHVVML